MIIIWRIIVNNGPFDMGTDILTTPSLDVYPWVFRIHIFLCFRLHFNSSLSHPSLHYSLHKQRKKGFWSAWKLINNQMWKCFLYITVQTQFTQDLVKAHLAGTVASGHLGNLMILAHLSFGGSLKFTHENLSKLNQLWLLHRCFIRKYVALLHFVKTTILWNTHSINKVLIWPWLSHFYFIETHMANFKVAHDWQLLICNKQALVRGQAGWWMTLKYYLYILPLQEAFFLLLFHSVWSKTRKKTHIPP